MRRLKYWTQVLVASLFIVTWLSPAVMAYLDPSTGSYIFQIVLAGLMGALFAVKIFWKNLKAFFGNIFSRGNKGDAEQH